MGTLKPEFASQIKRLVIKAMFSDDELMDHLVLKGGNLLDVVYKISKRTSFDLDFSVDGDLGDPDALKPRIEKTLKDTFEEIDYVVFDVIVLLKPDIISEERKTFWGGYQINFKIIERKLYEQHKGDIETLRRNAASVGKRGSSKIEIDISKFEYCEPKAPFDLDNLTIYVYTPLMAVCEKLRAICQQMPEYVKLLGNHPSARARDFLDIYMLMQHFGIDLSSNEISELISKTFQAKRVPIHLLGKIGEYREYHRPDFEAVKSTIGPDYPLKEFDFYFDFVINEVKKIKIPSG